MKEDELNEFGHGLLHKAVIHNRVNEFARLLNIGYDINQQDELGFSPLHLASLLGRNIIIRFIIFWLNRSKNHQDEDSEALLHSNGDISNIDYGFLEDIKINNLTKRGQSALHLAAKNGHSETVELLLKLGCDIKILDSSRKSALDIAKKCKHEHCTKILGNLQCKGRMKSYIKEDCNRDDTIDGMQPKDVLSNQREDSNDIRHRKLGNMLSASDGALFDKSRCRDLKFVEYPTTKSIEERKSEARTLSVEENENFESNYDGEGEMACKRLNSVEYTKTKSEVQHKSEVRKLSGEQNENFSSRARTWEGEKSCMELKSVEYTETKSDEQFIRELRKSAEAQNESFPSKSGTSDGERSCEKLNAVEYTEHKNTKQCKNEVKKLIEEQELNFASKSRSWENEGSFAELKSVECTEIESEKQDNQSTEERNEAFASRSGNLDDEKSYAEFKSVACTDIKSEKQFSREDSQLIEEKYKTLASRPSNLDDEKSCTELKPVDVGEITIERQHKSEVKKEIEDQNKSFSSRANTLNDNDPCEELKLVGNPDTKIRKLYGSEVEESIDNEMITTDSNIVASSNDETGIDKRDHSFSELTTVANLRSETEISRATSDVFPWSDHNYMKKMEEDVGNSKLLGLLICVIGRVPN
eukprot:Seg951.5 transcript_id=Seg951.5/GoldUCD/mRNA.D3Y31 product="26S proteasome non-ATPase regulatory subunit 10" protein_id=Seg951.5/GoldUCD/D3Y31